MKGKVKRIAVRLTEKDFRLIRRGARLNECSVTAFVVGAAAKAGVQAIEDAAVEAPYVVGLNSARSRAGRALTEAVKEG